jgi:PAS domain S-box-containing protein
MNDDRKTKAQLINELQQLRQRLSEAEAASDDSAEREPLNTALSNHQLLFENARDIILFVRYQDGRILEANPAAEQAYGYSRAELLTKTITDLRAASTQPNLAAQMNRAAAEGIHFETIHRRRDGREFPVEVNSRGATLGGERVLLSIIRDIGERQLAEQRQQEFNQTLARHNAELDAERARWRAAIEGMADEVWLCDAQGKISLMNLLAVTRMGLEEFKDKSVAEVLNEVEILNPDGQPRPADQAPLLRSLRGEIVRGEEILRHRQSGRIRYRQFSSAPTRDATGAITGAVAIVRDITEYKQAQEALRHSEEHYRRALDNMLEGCQIIDAEWRYVYVNAAAARQGHHIPDELLQHTMLEVYPGIETTELFAVLQRCMTERSSYHLENEFAYADGDIGWFDLSIRPVPEGLFILSIDITERKRAEKARHESEARLAGVITSAMDAIITIDAQQRIVLFNAAAERMLLVSAGDVIGQPIERFIPERYQALHRQHIRHFDETGITTRSMGALNPLSAVRANGEEFPIEASISQITIDGQKLFTVILRDITIRKHAAEALRRAYDGLEQRVDERTAELQAANRQLRQQADLIELAPAAIFVRDLQSTIVYWSHGAEAMYGWSRAEAVGQISYQLLQTQFPESRSATEQALLTSGLWEGELIQTRRDGARLIVTSRWALQRDEHDAPSAMLEINLDITERKRAEEAVQQLNQHLEQYAAQLEASNKELESFSYSISHDLRAPLRAINGFARILLEDYTAQLPLDAQRYLQILRDNARQMGQLIDDLLAFSRLNRQPLVKRPIDLTGQVQQTLADLGDQRNGRNVEIIVGELPPGEADPALLRQVWINLLSNALKYTRSRDPARIEVGSLPSAQVRAQLAGELADPYRARVAADMAEVSPDSTVYFVRDNGVGFDMRYADKLFGVFQRLHRVEDFEGTGVGLAIIQRIIHRHGGRVWAVSGVDQGATFYFTL